MRTFVALNLPGKLFLNMTPVSFTDSQYRDGVTREILQGVGLSAERIAFELTESQPLDELDLLRTASDHFRGQGFAEDWRRRCERICAILLALIIR